MQKTGAFAGECRIGDVYSSGSEGSDHVHSLHSPTSMFWEGGRAVLSSEKRSKQGDPDALGGTRPP